MAIVEQELRETLNKMLEEQRTFTRVPFEHPVHWSDANGEEGAATLNDVSRGGLSLSMSRYLRPGPALLITFDDILYQSQPIKLPVLTTWCWPEPQTPDRFVAGFSIVHGERETLAAISEVFYQGLNKYGRECTC